MVDNVILGAIQWTVRVLILAYLAVLITSPVWGLVWFLVTK
jgi:hypothetical protein